MIPFVFCLIFDVVLIISSGGGERVRAGRRMRTVIELLFLKLSKLKLTWLWWWYFQQLVVNWKAHSGNLRHHHLFTLDNNFLIMLYRACLHLFAGFVFENSTSHLMQITCQSWIILRPVINKFFILTSYAFQIPQDSRRLFDLSTVYPVWPTSILLSLLDPKLCRQSLVYWFFQVLIFVCRLLHQTNFPFIKLIR